MLPRSFIINHLQKQLEDMNVGVAYIYCSYKEAEQQTLPNLLASLVHQLIPRNSILKGDLVALYEIHMIKDTRPSIDDYTILLQAAVAALSKVLIIIDALDECIDQDGTRQILLDELRKLQSKACLLITSRDLPSIQRQLRNATRLDIESSGIDIMNYLDEQVRNSDSIGLYVKKYPELHGLIVKTITNKARGM